jgi:hypothetical protein
MQPDECRSVDAYWRYGDSVYFVLLHGSGERNYRGDQPGLYYRFDREQRQDVFDAFLREPVVSVATVDAFLGLLETLIDRGIVGAARAGLVDGEGRWLPHREPLARVD